MTGPFVHLLDTRMNMELWWSDGVPWGGELEVPGDQSRASSVTCRD